MNIIVDHEQQNEYERFLEKWMILRSMTDPEYIVFQRIVEFRIHTRIWGKIFLRVEVDLINDFQGFGAVIDMIES